MIKVFFKNIKKELITFFKCNIEKDQLIDGKER